MKTIFPVICLVLLRIMGNANRKPIFVEKVCGLKDESCPLYIEKSVEPIKQKIERIKQRCEPDDEVTDGH